MGSRQWKPVLRRTTFPRLVGFQPSVLRRHAVHKRLDASMLRQEDGGERRRVLRGRYVTWGCTLPAYVLYELKYIGLVPLVLRNGTRLF